MLVLMFMRIVSIIAITLRQSHCLPESFKEMGEGIESKSGKIPFNSLNILKHVS